MQKIDLTGQRFGNVVVLNDSGNRATNKKIIWHCLCDCGKEFDSTVDSLRRLREPSCGCKNHKKEMYIGYKVGKLTVTKDLGLDKEQKHIWECTCDCGNTVVHSTSALNFGRILSCGCLKHETGKKLRKYNARDRKLYFRWNNIRERCYNPNNKAYKNYGGRGIEMCPEWQDDFYTFRDWAISNGYNESLSLDRIDNNKGYSPDNCRWATDKTQSNNRRSNRYITINGVTKTMMQWSEELNIPYSRIQSRLEAGWTAEDAVIKPVVARQKTYKYRKKEADM